MNIIPKLTDTQLANLELVSHPVFSADSYKYSHFFQINPEAEELYSHYLNRGGDSKEVFFCGLKDIIVDNLNTPLTMDHLYPLRTYCEAHGIPYNHEGFHEIVTKFGGLFPVEIRSVPELQIYPLNLPLFTIVNTGSNSTSWVPGFLETLLMKVWYPSSVATKALEVKAILKPYFDISSEAPDVAINYSYVNFGSRAGTCEKQSIIGAMAHLHVFNATDGFRGVPEHNIRYGSKPSDFVSIPASEHSVVCSNITSTDRPKLDQELDAILRYVTDCIARGYKLFAWVIDTNDTYAITNAVTSLDSPIRLLLEANNAKLVLRPDSGIQIKVLRKMVHIMTDNYVFTINSRDYFTSPNFSVIWGDGTTPESIEEMCNLWVAELGCSMDILAFGSGGNLIQSVGRDDHRTAIKASSILVNQTRSDISKNPIGDPSKKSMGGRVVTCKDPVTGKYYVGDMDKDYEPTHDIMKTIYKVG